MAIDVECAICWKDMSPLHPGVFAKTILLPSRLAEVLLPGWCEDPFGAAGLRAA